MKRTWALGAVLALAAGAADSQSDACTDKDRIAAAQEIERIVGWDQLHRAWRDYRQCDGEAISELYTEALLRLIVEWKNVRGLADPFASEAGYRQFVLKHLRDPYAKDDLESIYSRAKMDCPAGLDAFCQEIAAAARPGASPPPAAPAPTPVSPPSPSAAGTAQPSNQKGPPPK